MNCLNGSFCMVVLNRKLSLHSCGLSACAGLVAVDVRPSICLLGNTFLLQPRKSRYWQILSPKCMESMLESCFFSLTGDFQCLRFTLLATPRVRLTYRTSPASTGGKICANGARMACKPPET